VALNAIISCPAGRDYRFLGLMARAKTTTMRILTGYMPPSKERPVLPVLMCLRIRSKCGGMWLSAEKVRLYRDMTVYGYLKFAAQLSRPEHPRAH